MATPSLKATVPPVPKKPTKALIDKYLALEEKRKKLARDAKQLGKETADLEGEMEAYVRANTAGKKREMVICGYRMSILQVAGTVAWKKEFIAALGQAKADKLQAAAPQKDDFEIAKA